MVRLEPFGDFSRIRTLSQAGRNQDFRLGQKKKKNVYAFIYFALHPLLMHLLKQNSIIVQARENLSKLSRAFVKIQCNNVTMYSTGVGVKIRM